MGDAKELGIGQKILTQQSRDAIHFAVIPVTAGEKLKPGQRVGVYRPNSLAYDENHPSIDSCIGIVDPFLQESVLKEEQFWLFLMPNTITSIRHDWYHPSFPNQSNLGGDEAARRNSEAWLRKFAEDNESDFNYLIKSIADGGICFGCDEGPENARDEEDEIRRHYRNVTGMDAPSDLYFRCAC